MRLAYVMFLLCLGLIVPWNANAQSVSKSTIEEQKSVEVTVYNSNLGLVKDVRKFNLSAGSGELRFMDVAAYIIPETVHIKELSGKGKFMVLEQNYEYDLMNPSKLLDKYVGKKVKLIYKNQYQDKEEIVEGELLSNNNSQPIYKINDEIYLGHPGIHVLPQIPENLIAKPTLMWLYENGESVDALEVSYLTNNINWRADYVLVLNEDDTLADLSGWVTVDNKSGTMYKDASLKLVAGEVNRAAQEGFQQKYARMDLGMAIAEAPAQFAEQGFFEYHIYDLQRKTTLKENQTKQISLLEASLIKVEKEYLVYGVSTYYNMAYRENNPKQPVNVNIKFKNSQENHLGMPLPAGIMRLYKEDSENSLQFVGEDRIDHTPKDEEVKIKVGEAFDIVAQRKQIDFRVISPRISESEWEMTLKNHKEENIVVGVIEPIQYSDWEVLSSSHQYKKEDAFTLRFDVPVPKDEEVKITYRIRVTWQ